MDALKLIDDSIDLSAYLNDQEEGVNIRPAAYFRDALRLHFLGGGIAEGAQLPWAKTHEIIRLRSGEVSLWHGENYSGKTTITSHIAASLCAHGWRVLIMSLEMSPQKTLAKIARQTLGIKSPDEQTQDQFINWTDERLWIYDKRGSVRWDKIVAVIRYARDKFDIHHIFIDNLMKCVRGEDDYNGQKDFIDALCTAALECDVHIHLIHHTKKPGQGSGVPGRYDAKGSGSISDQVDNVFGVWRNRNDKRDAGDPDCIINCDKQRHGEWDGKLALWYDATSQRYGERGASNASMIYPARMAA